MRRSTRLIAALVALGTGPTLAAAVPRPPLTPAEAQRLAASAGACTGGYMRSEHPDEPTLRRSAADLLPALPAAGDDGSTWSSKRAGDAYELGTAMLESSFAFSVRPSDGGSSPVDCTQDPKSAVRLLRFLAGEGADTSLGAVNVHHWLAEAYRAGAGVPADPARARRHFLIARLFGFSQIGPSDWGENAGDTFARLYGRPSGRALFEEMAAAGIDEAQLIVADIVMATEPKRARALIESAAASGDSDAIKRLAEHEVKGTFGKRNPERAAVLLARITCKRCDTYGAMLAAASAHNGGGEIPILPRRIGIDELGGVRKLLPDPTVIDRDSLVGTVEARGLMGPDGRIVYVELPAHDSVGFTLMRATLTLYRPEKLARLAPHVVGGKAVFAWVDLPPVTWGWDHAKAAPRMEPQFAPR